MEPRGRSERGLRFTPLLGLGSEVRSEKYRFWKCLPKESRMSQPNPGGPVPNPERVIQLSVRRVRCAGGSAAPGCAAGPLSEWGARPLVLSRALLGLEGVKALTYESQSPGAAEVCVRSKRQ
uniref:Uncharacterized protein n=1 Tax=Molossus molossus TaxID=27622 RepID=A0A7J8C963_MOLMO|nr:hypothetical protein HJG59_009984 [Molossus molossus]